MKPTYKLTRRGWIVLWTVVILLASLITYATRDVCYVGEKSNALGYGSCSKMLDEVIK
jgi:hypothetical protein